MRRSIWEPISELENFFHKYGKLKTGNSEDSGQFEIGDWNPVVDISENKDEFLVKAEIPGVSKENVSIQVDDRVLTVKGEKKLEYETDNDKTHRSECLYGSFIRSFTLPKDVEEENIRADYKNGVLTLTIPKSEKAKPKQIEVKIK